MSHLNVLLNHTFLVRIDTKTGIQFLVSLLLLYCLSKDGILMHNVDWLLLLFGFVSHF